MKLTSCPRCERLVRTESSSCPFCQTRLGTTSPLTRMMITAVVGLSLTACVDKDDMDTGAETGPTTTAPTTGATTDTSTSSEGGYHSYDGAGDTYTGPGFPTDDPWTSGTTTTTTTTAGPSSTSSDTSTDDATDTDGTDSSTDAGSATTGTSGG